MKEQGKNADVRKAYASPEVKRWGTVSELTRAPQREAGRDAPGKIKVVDKSLYPV